MNEWDKDNLRFLLNVSPAVFEDWMAQADADDIDYAIELLTVYRTEIHLMAQDIQEEENPITDFSDAHMLINVIKAKMQ